MAPGIIYNWENKRSRLRTPVSIGLRAFWKPKAPAPFAVPREYEQQIKLIQSSGKKGHCRAWSSFFVTLSHCHHFSFSVIPVHLGTSIRNSYPCCKFPPLKWAYEECVHVCVNDLPGSYSSFFNNRALHTWLTWVASSHDLQTPSGGRSRDPATATKVATTSARPPYTTVLLISTTSRQQPKQHGKPPYLGNRNSQAISSEHQRERKRLGEKRTGM